MNKAELKPGVVVRGPVFPEPVEVLVVQPLGSDVKVPGAGKATGQVHQRVLTDAQLAHLTASPDKEPFDGDPARFRLGVEAHRLALAHEYDPYFTLSIARVDPLPHQLEAVYDYFLKLPRIRFLLLAVIVFANKETSAWEAMLEALVRAGWIVTASWPIDTESGNRLRAKDSAALSSSIHLVCRPREAEDGAVTADAVGDWRDVLTELPRRIHEWMPRLATEGIVGADAIFACLGPSLEVFSRYSRVEKASGDTVSLKEYLEHVWAAVAKEALSMIFEGAETSGFEEDSRLTAMWLWTVAAGGDDGANESRSDDLDEEPDGGSKAGGKGKSLGLALEFDAARKIAQGLGADLDRLTSLLEVKGDTVRLLPVAERTRVLFGKAESEAPRARRKAKVKQMSLGFVEELEEAEGSSGWGQKGVPQPGSTVLDRVHQSMILFAAGRGEALRRFLVDEGTGRDARFWRLAQALAALYPTGTDERRWVEGVLARKKGLGF